MTRTRRILLTLIAVGVFGLTAAFGVFSAFTATTANSGNSVTSGTVVISDNDGGSAAMYVVSAMKPGDSVVKCIRVTYTGSLAATVKLYASAGITGGTTFNLQVERGSGLSAGFPDCTGFTPAATVYNGALTALGTDYAGGVDARGSAWSNTDTVDYRFTVSQGDDATPNAHTSAVTSGLHTFTWEAHSN